MSEIKELTTSVDDVDVLLRTGVHCSSSPPISLVDLFWQITYYLGMTENEQSSSERKKTILHYIDHSLKIIEDSGLQGISIAVDKSALEQLRGKVLANRISFDEAEREWNRIDSDMQQRANLEKWNTKNENNSAKNWWNKIRLKLG